MSPPQAKAGAAKIVSESTTPRANTSGRRMTCLPDRSGRCWGGRRGPDSRGSLAEAGRHHGGEDDDPDRHLDIAELANALPEQPDLLGRGLITTGGDRSDRQEPLDRRL